MTQGQDLPAGVYSYGDPGLPTVLLLHSSQSNSSQWRALIRSLETKFHLLAVDLLGYGRAPQQPELSLDGALNFSFENEIPRVIAAVDKCMGSSVSTQGVHLVGHSYGGALALKLASEKPFKIASLAVYEPVAFHLLRQGSAAKQEITEIADKMHELDALAATQAFVDYWNFPGYFQALPEKVQRAMAMQAGKVQCDFNALMHEPKTLQDYAAIDIPVLLIQGKRSQNSAHSVAQLLVDALPNLTSYEVDAGHMAPLTHPDLVNPLLSDFLSAQADPS